MLDRSTGSTYAHLRSQHDPYFDPYASLRLPVHSPALPPRHVPANTFRDDPLTSVYSAESLRQHGTGLLGLHDHLGRSSQGVDTPGGLSGVRPRAKSTGDWAHHYDPSGYGLVGGQGHRDIPGNPYLPPDARRPSPGYGLEGQTPFGFGDNPTGHLLGGGGRYLDGRRSVPPPSSSSAFSTVPNVRAHRERERAFFGDEQERQQEEVSR